ncbi:MAG: NAD-dependent epimerase/dehydratase family protein [Candidatus Methanoperedens sp.]|nr:NAD-dependent epimerase/dehydratase family protein [Candidatus Methanoperedens sp.]
MRHTILVVGATGMLGEPVARQLQKDGYAVRVLARNPEKARAKLGESFEYFRGDVGDISSLEKALDGCFGVHINLRGGPKAEDFDRIEHRGTANIARVSATMGVQRISYLSGAAVFEENSWFPSIKAKLQAEAAIRESGVPYSVFCATHFMESLPLYIRGKRASVLGKQPHRLHWLAAGDYAKMVSKAFLLPEAMNKRFFIYGPEALTIPEALEKYCSIVHPGVKVSSVPIWLMSLIGKVSLNTELQFIAGLMRFFDRVGEGGNPEEASKLLCTPITTLERWSEKQRNIA